MRGLSPLDHGHPLGPEPGPGRVCDHHVGQFGNPLLDRPAHDGDVTAQIVLGVGQSLVRISDRDGYDHFPHTLGTTEETVSLHLYSQHGGRGQLVPEPDSTR